MKKFSIILVAVAAVMFSCSNGSNVSLKTQNDSLSYAISIAKTEGLAQVMYQQLGVDSAYVDDFIAGVRASFAGEKNDKKATAYKAGLQIGLQAERVCEAANNEVFPGDSVNSINKELFLEGLVAGVKENGMMTFEESKAFYLQSVYKTKSDAFMEANKANEGVITTESGLQYKVIADGNDQRATATDTVKCIYKGTFTDGRTFDSSRNKEVSFAVNQVIPGWTEALQMMGKGAKWTLFIPWNLAYGEDGNRNIPPYSALIFELEVTDIVKAK